jgi:hypothetical protein
MSVYGVSQLVVRYGVSAKVVRELHDKVLGREQRAGRTRIVTADKLPLFEAGLKALGYDVRSAEPVA